MRRKPSALVPRSCEECGTTFRAHRRGKAYYCSDACRQKAYRRRKKERDAAKAQARSMDVYMTVDTIMQDIDELSRDQFSDRLWKVLDTIVKEERKLAVADIVYRAIQNSTYRIERISQEAS